MIAESWWPSESEATQNRICSAKIVEFFPELELIPLSILRGFVLDSSAHGLDPVVQPRG